MEQRRGGAGGPFEFPILPGTEQLHLGVILALIAVAVMWFVLERTTFGFDIKAAGLGPVLKGGGGIESGLGEGTKGGKGGAGEGFGLRGSGSREAIPGVTRASELWRRAS